MSPTARSPRAVIMSRARLRRLLLLLLWWWWPRETKQPKLEVRLGALALKPAYTGGVADVWCGMYLVVRADTGFYQGGAAALKSGPAHRGRGRRMVIG